LSPTAKGDETLKKDFAIQLKTTSGTNVDTIEYVPFSIQVNPCDPVFGKKGFHNILTYWLGVNYDTSDAADFVDLTHEDLEFAKYEETGDCDDTYANADKQKITFVVTNV